MGVARPPQRDDVDTLIAATSPPAVALGMKRKSRVGICTEYSFPRGFRVSS
ncbi:MAG: hypothetical protein Q4A31_04405 [Corynebacterium sp.]|uniref:hypothetical protein n=1 Tax=Corynebacterium sp. TaxID=1720 RepID=UPI0026DB4D60|nr:hypothetical protein [Corynebacterium sp.]MDO4761137.1 hypothetical protein [Corynebacterium sp.]